MPRPLQRAERGERDEADEPRDVAGSSGRRRWRRRGRGGGAARPRRRAGAGGAARAHAGLRCAARRARGAGLRPAELVAVAAGDGEHRVARGQLARARRRSASRRGRGRAPAAARARMRALTKMIGPRRWASAGERGPAGAPISASRACRCGQPASVSPSSTGRRSPGSRTLQPPALASARASEAAARTAASSASSLAAPRGSSTTTRAALARRVRKRSCGSAPRATAGQKIRDAGVPSRSGRMPVELDLGADGRPAAARDPRRVAAAGRGDDRLDARQDEQLVVAAATGAR